MGTPDLTSPIPLSDIENVLSWVDNFKLSRPTKKINRDFSDGVLLAEILAVHYPKLVDMHNYPPRNSQAQKLNNWMTLNRKVFRKLKLNLCLKTMEQLSNCAPGSIERVLILIRDKIKRDEEAAKSEEKDLADQNMSSGGSYYEACTEEDNVLVVPVKQRTMAGALETVQKKVVSHDLFLCVKEELKDAKEVTETLKQKVEHFENIIKLKEDRIEELQKQLSRKVSRRKENEELRNSISVPLSLSEPPLPKDNSKFTISEGNSIEKETELREQPYNLDQIELKEKIDVNTTNIDANGINIEVEDAKIDVKPSRICVKDNRIHVTDSKIDVTPNHEDINDKVTGKNSKVSIKDGKVEGKESKTSVKSDQIVEKEGKTEVKGGKLEMKTDLKENKSEVNLARIEASGTNIGIKDSKTEVKPSKIPVMGIKVDAVEGFFDANEDIIDKGDEEDDIMQKEVLNILKSKGELNMSYF